MGLPMPDFMLEEVILAGLDDIYKNMDARLADIFEDFHSPQLLALHGKRHLDIFKTFLQTNKIRVIQGWTLVPQSVPAYSINLAAQTEAVSQAFLGDYAGSFDTVVDPTNVVINFIPTSYDSTTGYVTVADGVDLGSTFIGYQFVDFAENSFSILSGIVNTIGEKKFNIGPSQVIDITGNCNITTPEGSTRSLVRCVPYRMKLEIGCHTENDPNVCKMLFAILYYILLKYKLTLENYGLFISVSSATDLSRLNQYLPDNIFTRTVMLDSLTYLATISETNTLMGTSDIRLVVRVPRDDWSLQDIDYTLNTTIDSEQTPLPSF